eukprot:scaffold1053_cov332-Pavlova_lutheri.AAC.8
MGTRRLDSQSHQHVRDTSKATRVALSPACPVGTKGTMAHSSMDMGTWCDATSRRGVPPRIEQEDGSGRIESVIQGGRRSHAAVQSA